MAIAALRQRAEILAQNPGNIQAVNALAQELRNAVVPPDQQQVVNEAFFFLAQAQQWLEYNQGNLAGHDVDEVRPPDAQFEDQLIQPLPPMRPRQPVQDRRALAAPPQPPEPQQVLPQAPAQAQVPAQAPVPAPAQAQVPAQAPVPAPVQATPTPAQQGLLERIWAVVSKAIKTVIEFIVSTLCCIPRTQTPPANGVRPPVAQPVQPPAPQPQAPVQPPQQQVNQPVAQPQPQQPPPVEPPVVQPQQAVVAPLLLADGVHQVVGEYVGNLNIGGVGPGQAIAPYCAADFMIKICDTVRLRADLAANQQAEALIDLSFRDARAALQQHALFPRIEPVVIDQLGVQQNYLRQLQLLDRHAGVHNDQHMTAALLRKGDQIHVLLVDARERNHRRYYYYNPNGAGHGAYLKVCTNIHALAHHLTGALPIEAENPFTVNAVTVRPAQ